MPANAILSEIDAIFASKPVASGSRPLAVRGPTKDATKKKTQQRTRRISDEIHAKKNLIPAQRQAERSQQVSLTTESQENPPRTQKKNKKTSFSSVETEVEQVTEVVEFFDPSVALVESSSSLHHQHPHDLTGSSRSGPPKRNVQLDEEELAFRDSRGTRARTDDGLPIYSVEELRIGLGGETEACPFDCECCF